MGDRSRNESQSQRRVDVDQSVRICSEKIMTRRKLTTNHPGELVGGSHKEATKDLLVDIALLRMHVHGGAQTGVVDWHESGAVGKLNGLGLDGRAVQLFVGKHASMKATDVLAVEQESLFLAGWHLFERRGGFGTFALLVTLAHRK